MKVHIVYLSSTDDIDSTRDMLGWVQAPRAVLVWPSTGEVLKRRYDLLLLKRYAEQRNVALGLLTFDPEIRESAGELGFPVFESLDDLPEEKWSAYKSAVLEKREPFIRDRISRPVEAEPAWASQFESRLSRAMMVRLVLAFVVLGLLLGPSAEVVLSPPRIPLEHEFIIQASGFPAAYEGIHFAQYEIQVSAQASAPATGFTSAPFAAAQGEVVFSNLSTEKIRIPAHLELRTVGPDPVRFETTAEAVLPAGPNVERTVVVTAITLGKVGNLSAGEEFAIDGPLGLILSVTNVKPFFGGSDRVLPSVSPSDFENLRAGLESKLLKTAESKIRVGLSDSEYLIEGGTSILETIETFDYGVFEIADAFQIDMELNARVIVLNRDDLEEVLRESFQSNLPGGQLLLPDSIGYRVESVSPDVGNMTSSYRVIGTALSFAGINHRELVRTVRGRTAQGALKQLNEDLPVATDARIDQHPSWFPLLPILGGRIRAQYEWDV